jgi:protein gp37
MSDKTGIEWTDATWNPMLGCTKVSPGCKGCYAINHVHRMAGNPNPKVAAANEGLTIIEGGHPSWTGRVRLIPERLEIPLKKRKPTMYFVNSLSDLFHEDLPDKAIDRVFASMALCPQHTFQVLTKRAERMERYCSWSDICAVTAPRDMLDRIGKRWAEDDRRVWRSTLLNIRWPLPNVWLGVSVESRDYLGRIDHLRKTPAAVRFLSLEPLLEDLGGLSQYLMDRCPECGRYWKRGWRDCPNPETCDGRPMGGIDWVIVGGESGPGARMMQANWARSIRDQCTAAGVPFFFKQWGEYLPDRQNLEMDVDSRHHSPESCGIRYGKKRSGRLLDGRTWDQFPEVHR